MKTNTNPSGYIFRYFRSLKKKKVLPIWSLQHIHIYFLHLTVSSCYKIRKNPNLLFLNQFFNPLECFLNVGRGKQKLISKIYYEVDYQAELFLLNNIFRKQVIPLIRCHSIKNAFSLSDN